MVREGNEFLLSIIRSPAGGKRDCSRGRPVASGEAQAWAILCNKNQGEFAGFHSEHRHISILCHGLKSLILLKLFSFLLVPLHLCAVFILSISGSEYFTTLDVPLWVWQRKGGKKREDVSCRKLWAGASKFGGAWSCSAAPLWDLLLME